MIMLKTNISTQIIGEWHVLKVVSIFIISCKTKSTTAYNLTISHFEGTIINDSVFLVDYMDGLVMWFTGIVYLVPKSVVHG